LTEVYEPSLKVLADARLPTVLITSLLAVAVYLILGQTVNQATGVVAALFLSLDPFFVGLSRLLHHDALHSSFALLNILTLGLALRSGQRGWFAVSGVAAGLAFLSKSVAVVLIPLNIVILAGLVVVCSSPAFKGGHKNNCWRDWSIGLIVINVAIGLTVFAVYPAMWVQPVEALRQIFDTATTYATSVHEGGNFFFGRPVDDPGPLFYPVVLLLRGTPFALLGAVVTWVLLAQWAVRGRGRRLTSQEMWIVLLWGMVIVYTVVLSLGIKKVSRYILPASLAVDLLGGIGLATPALWIGDRVRLAAARWIPAVGLSLIMVGQAALCVSHYPYYTSYYNPLLGGGQVAQRIILVGWGEGFDQVIRYLNAQEGAENIVLSTTHGSLLDFRDFKGVVVDFPPKWSSDKPRYPLAQVDYICIYLNWLQTHPLSDSFYDLFESRQPEFTARADGIEYAWLYKVDKRPYLTLPGHAVEVGADYGNGLRLVGYETFEVSKRAEGGWNLPVKIYWQVERPCVEGYRLVLRLVDETGREWASDRSYPPWGPTDCDQSLGRWRGDLIYPDEHWLGIGADTPPGSYDLEAIIVRKADGRPLSPVARDRPVRLGSVKVPDEF
jgi:hypothetical protein